MWVRGSVSVSESGRESVSASVSESERELLCVRVGDAFDKTPVRRVHRRHSAGLP